jgi:hypothetical protein
MGVVLGIVVNAEHQQRFADAAATICGVTLRWVLYSDETEIHAGVDRLLARHRVDGLLLGPMPYQMCRDVVPPDLPVEITMPTQTDLAIALHRAAARGWDGCPVSVDTFDRQTVREVAAAIGADEDSFSCIPFTPEQHVDQIVQWHRDFLARCANGYVITLRTAVARELRETARVLNPLTVPSSIRAALHNLIAQVRAKHQDALRLASGVFLVPPQPRSADLDRARAGLMHLLLSTPELGDAWIENRGRNGVVAFGHRALFEKFTDNWQTISILGQAEATLRLRVAAGFGIGSSARTCVRLAEQAAHRALKDGVPCGYLIEERGLIIGPMARAATSLEFTYREHGTALETLARTAGISSATLSRIAAVDRRLAGDMISPSDLADGLGVTDPSGRRLLRKLTEHGLAVPCGSAQENRKGRPTRLYRLRVEDAIEQAI